MSKETFHVPGVSEAVSGAGVLPVLFPLISFQL